MVVCLGCGCVKPFSDGLDSSARFALAVWGLLRGLIPLLEQRLLDQPNPRSALPPYPRGGGVALYSWRQQLVGLRCLIRRPRRLLYSWPCP